MPARNGASNSRGRLMDKYAQTIGEVRDNFTCDDLGRILLTRDTTRSRAGAVVGHKLLNGYIAVVLPKSRKKVYAHHIVWFITHGVWAPATGKPLDHIDRDRANNRPPNLRLVTTQENAANNGLDPRRTNQLRGASAYVRGGRVKYKAQLRYAGKTYVRNSFLSAEDAHAWYVAKKMELSAA